MWRLEEIGVVMMMFFEVVCLIKRAWISRRGVGGLG